ncbi:MAG: hypothetical protein HZC54_04870 [Verrucomicrobia bacterium]|nr:hypothetical protein [Verrucomicrobiota bacterium]
MKLKIAKVVVRVIGTLIALVGLTLLVPLLLMLTTHTPAEQKWVLLLVLLMTLPFAVWFIYVGYSAWFNLSPSVVRHVWAVFMLMCFSSISSRMVTGTQADIDSPWLVPASIGLFLAAWAIHRVVCKQLNHWLFPEFG